MKTSAALATVTAALLAFVPGRAAADPAAIFVSNYDNGAAIGGVSAFSTTGAAATGYTAPAGFSNPEGVAYNPANGMLYVADESTSKIRTFDATTGVETQLGFASVTGLSNPYGLALNAGVLYAANSHSNTITAYNAASGAPVTGFISPAGLSFPFGLAVSGTTLYVANFTGNTLSAFNLATGLATFTITGLSNPQGVALYGNDLFVSNGGNLTTGEYDATTGTAINASFAGNTSGPRGLAILGNRLLVASAITKGTVDAYGIPPVATYGNMPTSIEGGFITGLEEATFLAVVPEPGTWALLVFGSGSLLFVVRRRARRMAA